MEDARSQSSAGCSTLSWSALNSPHYTTAPASGSSAGPSLRHRSPPHCTAPPPPALRPLPRTPRQAECTCSPPPAAPAQSTIATRSSLHCRCCNCCSGWYRRPAIHARLGDSLRTNADSKDTRSISGHYFAQDAQSYPIIAGCAYKTQGLPLGQQNLAICVLAEHMGRCKIYLYHFQISLHEFHQLLRNAQRP